MAVAVVDALEVVEVGDHEADVAAESRRASQLEAERVLEAPPVRETGEAVDESLVLDEAMQLRVVECDDRLGGERTRNLDLGDVERPGDDHEMAEVRRARPERERDPFALPVRLADAGDLAVAADHDPAGGAGRLDGRLDDDAQQLPRIVRGDERLPEPAGRLPDPLPLGLEIGLPLLELRRPCR